MTDRGATIADVKAEDEARVRFDMWRDAFLSALQGSAGSARLVVNIVDDAARIADLAVTKIAARVPKESGR